MKANELRIGNWINWNEDKDNLGQIGGGGISMIEEDLVKVYPIPLTEEWLIKFGLKKCKDNPRWFDLTDHAGGEFNGVEFELLFYELSPCKYVHQLQNLYFALTGEELIIKT